MTFEQLHEILDNPNKKLTKTELCEVLYELKQDCFAEGCKAFDKNDMYKHQFYMGEVNAFFICLDLLEHLEVE